MLSTKKISFDEYVKCLNSKIGFVDNQCTIKSKLHKVYSIEQTKSMLDSKDDKRKILENNIDTLAWGHYSLQDQ